MQTLYQIFIGIRNHTIIKYELRVAAHSQFFARSLINRRLRYDTVITYHLHLFKLLLIYYYVWA